MAAPAISPTSAVTASQAVAPAGRAGIVRRKKEGKIIARGGGI
jgi:hypothetical protein